MILKTKKRIALFFGLLTCFFSGLSQTEIPTPKHLGGLNSVEVIEFSKIDNLQLRNQEFKSRKPGRANIFATPVDASLDCYENGTWEYLDTEVAVWRIILKSKNAFSINLGFSEYLLPKGGKLFLYDRDYTQIIGPFTEEDNADHLELWTPIIDGDEVILELQVPTDQVDKVRLKISKLNHDFMNYKSGLLSGSCNLDVVCGELDGWAEVDANRDIIQSVGAYTINGISQCSGVLINNTRNDCTPYFLTAFHCEVTEENDQTVVVYWNYQNSICRQPGSVESGQTGDGSKLSFSSGTEFRSAFELSDFTLLELEEAVNPDHNPYFAGWNNSSNLPSSAICIHHPGVEEKRISFDFDSLEYEFVEETDTAFLRVLDWDIGTTEGGSSGSPLFNQKKLVVGQLTGGQASCNNDLWDSFGWLHRSWEGGGTPSSRLKDWLDPDNTGAITMPGKSCAFTLSLSANSLDYCTEELNSYNFKLSVSENFSDTVHLNLLESPQSIQVRFMQDSLAPGDTTTVFLQGLDHLEEGIYTINIQASDDLDSNFSSFVLVPYNKGPSNINLVSPMNDSEHATNRVFLEWEGEADSFFVEIATDPSFEGLAFSGSGTTSHSFLSPELNSSQDYFWRVRGLNICGYGPWTNANQFLLGQIICNRFISNDLPQEIGTDSDIIIESVIDFPHNGLISDINLYNIKGRHTWVSDLSLSLTSPSGTTAILIENPCTDEDDFLINFDEDSGTSAFKCPLNDGQILKSQNPLSIFTGENPKGSWILKLVDGFAQDGGSFDNWELQICSDLSNEKKIISSINELEICDLNQSESAIIIGGGFEESLRFTIIDSSDLLEVSFDQNLIQPGSSTNMIISNLMGLPSGEHVLTVILSDGEASDSLEITIHRLPGPISADLLVPQIEEYDKDSIPAFKWIVGSDSDGHFLQISTDSTFEDLLYESNLLSETSYVPEITWQEGVTYFWRIKSLGLCNFSYSETSKFTISIRSSIHELGDVRINIFPNPFKDDLRIQFSNNLSFETEVEIFALDGSEVFRAIIPPNQHEFRIVQPGWPGGMYVLKMRLEDGSTIVDRIVLLK